MSSAVTRYSWRQLSRHRARAALTIATLAAAVLGVWLFAAPRNFEATMDERVESDLLHDVILRPDGVQLDDGDLAALRAVPNVEGLDLRATFQTEMRVGDRTQDVWLVGVRDFDDQQVNVIEVEEGSTPAVAAPSRQGLTDPVNEYGGRGAGAVGDTVLISSWRSELEEVLITGEGTSVQFAHDASEWIPVLYVPVEAVWELAPFEDVFTRVEFRVIDRDDAVLADTIDAVREQLADIKPSVRYNALVEIRPAGEWPGEDDFDNFLILFWVIAGVSLVSALVLVASTMTTLVRDQAREIAIMKSIGGSRRRIIANYLATSALLGAAGTAVGIAIGLPVSNLLTGYLGQFQGIAPDWRVSWLALGLSVAVGIGGTLVASMPALLRGTRVTVRQALGGQSDGAGFGTGTIDRLLVRARWLPRTAQIGLRGVARRKGRTIATQLQIALAVGTLLGFSAMLITMIEVSEQSRSAEGGDIELYTSGPGRQLDSGAAERVAAIDGVDRVQPVIGLDALVGETNTFAWGLPADPVYPYELRAGRWFSAAENDDRASVAVVGPALATIDELEVGDTVRAETLGGPVPLEVVGIDSTMVGDGQALFVPIDTALSLTGRGEPSWFWITTTSSNTADIDRVATEIRETLDRGGYAYRVDERYIARNAERREDRTIVAIVLALGIPVVAMGMIGLVSAMTTNIVERTREIGILRSIGARSRDIRRVFLAEATVLVLLGWLTGIAVGYLIARIILRAFNNAFNVSFALRYPLWPIAAALVITLAIAMVVVRRPLRRAGRLSPSVALRYE
jgi:putative ABC transport system permease protein